MASSGQLSEIPHLVARIKTLTNPQLKELLRNEGLAVSGVKASLQLRIIDCSLSPSDTWILFAFPSRMSRSICGLPFGLI
jgi:hypothetical protein